MDAAKLRAWWWAKQGLDGSLDGASPADVLARAGWARSVGGSNPYLTVFCRSGAGRERIDEDVADLHIHELPSARGCTYVLPAEHFALGLALSEPFNEKGDVVTAKKWLGVTEEEIERLCTAILDALGDKVLDTNEIKAGVGDAVRSFGEEGKKRGVTTSLPIGLGRLQSKGLIRRVPVNGRLDQQRYRYTRWPDTPSMRESWPIEAAHAELARLFFTWIGPASLAQFQWFSALSGKVAKEVVADLNLVPIAPGSDLLILASEKDDFDAFRMPKEPRIAFLSSLDSLFLLRRDLLDLIDPVDQAREVFSERGLRSLGSLQDLPYNAIVDRGRVVGVWEYDGEASELVWRMFGDASDVVRLAADAMSSFIGDQLGDARSFSLDSPASRRPRLEALGAMG